MTSRRGSVDIIFDILNEISKLENQKNETVRKPTKIGKTQVMYLGNLSYAQANQYYSFCLNKELLQLKENGNLGVAPKGYDLMNYYKSMRELLKDDTSQLSLSRIDTQTVIIKK